MIQAFRKSETITDERYLMQVSPIDRNRLSNHSIINYSLMKKVLFLLFFVAFSLSCYQGIGQVVITPDERIQQVTGEENTIVSRRFYANAGEKFNFNACGSNYYQQISITPESGWPEVGLSDYTNNIGCAGAPNLDFTCTSSGYYDVLLSSTGYDYLYVKTTMYYQKTYSTAFPNIISGNAGVSGASLSFTAGTPKTVISDANGNYSLGVSNNWGGVVTVTKPGFSITPASKTYSNVSANITAQNYSATTLNFIISGNAGIAGATLSYFDGVAKTATADGTGNYSMVVSYNWSGSIVATKTDYAFSTAKSYTNVLADKTSQDFTAILLVPSIRVKQNSSDIPDESGSYNYGSLKTGAGTDIVFTIENAVTKASSLGSFSLSNTTDFSFAGTNPATIASGNPVTFAIRFMPVSEGMKTSTVSFSNQDGNKNPYNFTISGTGVLTAPAAPVATSATNISETGFAANWGSIAGATSYSLEVSADNFATLIGGSANEIMAPAVTKNISGLIAGADYKYRVKALNSDGSSSFSNVITVTTNPAIPKISSLTPSFGPIGSQVTINGVGFSAIPSNNTVYFGAVKATVISSTLTSITINVPAGAGSLVPVTVLARSLVAYSTASTTPVFNITNQPNLIHGYANSTITDPDVFDCVAIADFNGDGKPDLVTSHRHVVNNAWVGTVSVRLGNGAGGFVTKSNINIPYLSQSIVTGDFNGDGKVDIATSNSTTISILLGDGAGNFAITNIPLTNGYTLFMVAGDFNGDGKSDLAFTSQTYNSSMIGILLGNGSGSFGTPNYYPGLWYMNHLAAGDFNGDGKIDLAVTNISTMAMHIFQGNGSGGFSMAGTYSTGNNPRYLTVGDFNKDGKSDIVVFNDNGRSISVFLNNGSGSFGTSTTYPVEGCPMQGSTGDFNGDGNLDLFVPYYGEGQSTTAAVCLGNGTGSFPERTNVTVVSGPLRTEVGDFNMDGKADIVTTGSYVNLSLLLYKSPVPVVTTQDVTNISTNGATVNGNVTDLGGSNLTQYGVVWCKSQHPVADLTTKTNQGAKATPGVYTSGITGLEPNTTYYIRAYATNTVGTGYGEEKSFTTMTPTITSATYDAGAGVLIITGTGLSSKSGITNDIDVSKLTITGNAGATYVLTSPGVEITSETAFTVALNSTDKTAVNLILNKNGITSTGGTNYNMAAAQGWAASADVSVDIADLTGNEITVSNVPGPAISSVSVPVGKTYKAGETLDFTINFGEAITVITGGGVPYIPITLNTGGTVNASYFSGSGTTALTFRYTVINGNNDNDGLTIGSSITANGGTIKSSGGLDAIPSFNNIGSMTSVKVDALAPTATIVLIDNALKIGETSTVTITFTEAVTGFTNANLTIANGTLTNVSSTNEAITWKATLTPTANIEDATNVITLDNTGITDGVGNTGSGTTDSPNYSIDTKAPSAPVVTVPASGNIINDTTPAVSGTAEAGSTVSVYLDGSSSAIGTAIADASGNWSFTTVPLLAGVTPHTVKAISTDIAGNTSANSNTNSFIVDTTPPAAPVITAPANGNITNDNTPAISGTAEAGSTVTVYLDGSAKGTTTADASGNWTFTIVTNTANGPHTVNATSTDAAGNTSANSSTNTFTEDTTLPTISSVTSPSNGTYLSGQNLDFTVNFNEEVAVVTTGGTPYLTLTIGGNTVHAAYISGSGTVNLIFRYTTVAGDLDGNGISVGTITANGGTLKDIAGNNGTLTLNNVGSTAGVLIDAIIAPATQATAIEFSNVQTTLTTIKWSNGNGSSRAVFVKQANSGTASPVNNTNYSANTTLAGGTQIGSTGWYCVYNGTGSSVTVTGLSLGTYYIAQVFEYSGTVGSEKYNTTTSSTNPKIQLTPTVNPVLEPTLSGSSLVCFGSTGEVYTTEASMLNYSWNVSSGGVIKAGGTSTSNTVTVDWNTSGPQTVSVNYVNTDNNMAPSATVYNVTVNQFPIVNAVANQAVCNGSSTSAVTFSGTATETVFQWVNNTPSIGLVANGTGNIPSFLSSNNGNTPVTALITVTPAVLVPQTQSFIYTGAMQTWTVPAGVTSINIESFGAQGGSGADANNSTSGGAGGKGSKASGTLSVTPGQVLNIFVGGNGTISTAGFNGGGLGGSVNAGGGGGASDIRYPGNSIADRLIVAAGGGGGGRTGSNLYGVLVGIGGNGGNGDGNGINGTSSPVSESGYAGGGFGASGATGGLKGIGCPGYLGTDGIYGIIGIGGNGGGGQKCCSTGAPNGGGGGGGYLGGGGGGGGSAGNTSCQGNDKGSGGGGAGGTSYFGGVANGAMSAGVQTGNGKIVISYQAANCLGTPVAFNITVNPTPAAPLAGSNSYTYSGTVKTAVANVGSGETVDWYTDLTGGNTTTAPSGTNMGTHTAYAEARNTTTGCISASRTLISLVITAKPIEITAVAGQTKIFSNTDPTALTYTFAPALQGTDVITGSMSRISGENVGSYAYTMGTLTAGSNYSLSMTVAPGFSITPKSILVTAVAGQTKIYGASDPASLTYTLAPSLQGTDVITGSMRRTAGENADSYAYTTGTLTAGSNYTLSLAAVPKFIITAKPITVTANAGQSKVYGGVDPVLTYTYAPALIGGDMFTGLLTRATGENAGDHTIKIGTLSAGTNYTLNLANQVFNISKLNISGTFTAGNKTYDSNNTASITGRSLVGVLTADIANVSLAGGTATFSNALAGTGKVVTSAGMSLSGSAATNYNLTGVATTTANISPLNISGTFTAGNKTYDGNNTASITGRSLVGVLTADIANVSLAGGTATFSNTLAGTSKVVTSAGMSLSGTAALNYNLTGVATTTANISPLNISGTFTAGNKTYDSNNTASITGRSPVGVLTADIANVSLAGGTATFSNALAGTGKVVTSAGMSLSGTAATNYNLTGVATTTADINKAMLTVTTDAGQTKVYGDVDPVFTYTVEPALLGGDNFTGALSRSVGENVNTYAIDLGTLTNANYDITFVSNNFSITSRQITVIATTGQAKVFGVVDPTFSYSVSETLVSDNSFTGMLSRTTGENIGSYNINIGTLSAGTNYSINFVSNNFSITAKPITVTANTGQSKVYGGVDPVLTYTFAPVLIGSDTFSGALTRAAGENAGDHSIQIGTLSAGTNYTLNLSNQVFNISKLNISGTFTAGNKTYDANNTATITSRSLAGILTADLANVSLTGGTATYSNALVGTGKMVTLSGMSLIGTAALNYNLTGVATTTANISKLNISGTFTSSSKTYDGNNTATITVRSLEGVPTSDMGNLSLTGGTATFINALAGTAKVVTSAGMSLSGTAAPNYNLTGVATTTANINRAIIIVTAEEKTRVYGEADPVFTYTVAPALIDADLFTGALSRKNGEDVGLYAINAGTLNAGTNYTIAFVSLDLTITTKAITVTANTGQTKVYGANDPVLTYTVAPALVGSDILGGALSRAAGENIGSAYAIGIGTLTNPNYNITFTGDNFRINSKPIIVTANAGQTKVYGSADPVYTYLVSPALVGSDNFTGALSRISGENAGSYAINAGTLDAGTNYTVSFAGNDFSITAKPVTVTADAGQTKVYGSADPAFTFTVSETLASGNNFIGVLSRASGENVGAYAINLETLSAGENYKINFVSNDFSITQKMLSVNTPALTSLKTYNSSTVATVTAGTLLGQITGDESKVNVSAIANYTNKNVGKGKTINIVYSISGSASGNYIKPVDYTVSNGEITAKQLTIGNTIVTDNKMFDNNTNALVESVGTLSGVEAVDATHISITAVASYADAKVGVSKTITVVYTLGGSAVGNYIAPANLLINTAKISDKLVLIALQSPSAGCEGSGMELSYSVITGTPFQYQITFGTAALSAGFRNISFSDLESSGNSGIISIPVPSGIPFGTYQATLQVRNELGLVSDSYSFQFVVNVSTDYIVTKFDDVVLCDNKTNSFSSYQWYKNGKSIDGATNQFYNDPLGLVGAYSLKLKTVGGQDLQTCPRVLNIPKVKKVSVSVYPNPMRANQESTIKITGISNEELQGAVMSVYNIQGIRVYSTKTVEQINSLTLQNLDGSYVGHIITAKGNDYVYRILLVK